MRHSHTSRGFRTSAKAILAIVGLGFAGACADSVSAPTSDISAKAPAAYSKMVGVTTFKYTPKNGVTKRFGSHLIVIPADGICDPATSGYGKAFWDAPCSPVNHSIVITATSYTDVDGNPYVDFQPALRFVPTKETYLYLRDGKRASATGLQITYCATALSCEDESINDASLETHRVGKSQILGRRLKHFSGYNITAGGVCGRVSLGDEGGMICIDLGGMTRSGYMLASGLGKTGTPDSFGGRRRRADK
jgi:hypothetical protein